MFTNIFEVDRLRYFFNGNLKRERLNVVTFKVELHVQIGAIYTHKRKLYVHTPELDVI